MAARLEGERGSQAIEFVAALPLLVVVIFLQLQIGAVGYGLLQGQAVVRETARAVVSLGNTAEANRQAAQVANRLLSGRWQLCSGRPLIAHERGLVVARFRASLPVLPNRLGLGPWQTGCLSAAFSQEF